MSSPDPDDAPVAVPQAEGGPMWFPPAPAAVAQPPARRPWSAVHEVRGDLRTAALIAGALALSGFLVGLLWWLLAPRADFRITANGPAAIGNPSEEIFAADDATFALLMAGLGLLAGLVAWSLLRRRRGIAVLLALAVGTAAAGVIAWRLGELLGPAPSKAELADVGARVTTALGLHSLPALAVGPFCAVLVYLAAALFTRRDDLGRTHLPPPALAAQPTFPEPSDAPAGGPRA
jgi:hypothetical protein